MRGRPLAALLIVATVACGESAPAFDAAAVQLVVELRDYTLSPNVADVPAGETKIGIRNRGSQPHDLIVIRTEEAPDKLSYDASRAKASEDGNVGKIKELRAGGTAALTVTLEPGRYVLICNTAGHYMLGMRTALTVR